MIIIRGFVRISAIALALGISVAISAQAKANSHNPTAELVEAVKKGQSSLISGLIKNGADPNVRDLMGMSPLHYAAYRGDAVSTEALLKNGATPDIQDSLGMTPLHAAAFSGHPMVVKALLKAGASVNLKDHLGNTALHYAVYAKSLEAVRFLLASGADRKIANNKGVTPLKMARASGSKKLIALFSPSVEKKAPVIITNETLKTMPTYGSFVMQNDNSGSSGTEESGVEQSGPDVSQIEMSGRTATEKINAAYARIHELKEERRSLQDQLSGLKKKCDDYHALKRGEQVGNTRLAEPQSELWAIDLAGNLYYIPIDESDKDNGKSDNRAGAGGDINCIRYQRAQERIAAIGQSIVGLNQLITKLNALPVDR